MEEEREVNLAVIMFTDIVGYTSLTQTDEELAFKLLNEHRKIVRPAIQSHKGKEIKTIGDAFLVEFPSAVEAIACALEIQEALYNFNSERSEKILLRIGIHLGDILHSGSDVYGDAVNVCSRIEQLAESGGISISRQVYDSVRSRLRNVRFESLGVRPMKNVTPDIEVFKVVLPWVDGIGSANKSEEIQQPRNRIAVLPFVNISQDQSDEYFADGLTEELITRLSQAKDLRVIARTSALNYKNNRVKKVRDIARELGAGTVVEGSVRKAGNKIRVAVQVVNALNEEHLWATTYDRNLDDIFEIQQDIASKVADSFSSYLSPLIKNQVLSYQEEPRNLTAYTYFLRGRHLLYGENESSVKQALEFFNMAIKLDPGFARAHVGRAQCYLALGLFTHPWIESARKAEEDTLAALRLDPDLAEAHATLSQAKFALDEFASAEEEAKKAIELNPSLSDAYYSVAHLKWVTGHVNEATELYETAYKLDPLKEENVMMLGEMYFELGRDDDILKLFGSVEHLLPQSSYAGMVYFYLMKRDFAKVDEYFEKFRSSGPDSIFLLTFGGVIAAYKGEREKALEAVTKINETTSGAGFVANTMGEIYYVLGDLDKFFEFMNKAMDTHSLPLGNLVNSPHYEMARRDPRFKKLLGRIDLKVDLPPTA